MNIIVDTGFWIGLYDERDAHHGSAVEYWETYSQGNIFIVPYPSLYELIKTRLMRRKNSLDLFRRIMLDKSQVCLVSDEKYKDSALEITLNEKKRDISLVDCTIRMMLEDDTILKNGMLTTNREDFEDVCMNKNIELIDI